MLLHANMNRHGSDIFCHSACSIDRPADAWYCATNMIIIADILLPGVDREPIQNGAVVVGNGKIQAVGPLQAIRKTYARHHMVDCGRSALMPGLVNVHSHLELPELADEVRALEYVQWVLNLLQAKSHLSSADYCKAADRNIRNLIETGTTTVGEICTHQASPPAIRKHRIRAVIFHELIAMSQRSEVAMPRHLLRSRLVAHGLSPHSPHTVSPAVLAAVRDHARKGSMPLCMHVAESIEEQRLLRKEQSSIDRLYAAAGWDRSSAPEGKTSIEYLARMQVLSRRFLAVHAVQVSTSDIALLKKHQVAVAHCPRSNHAMAVGTMPLRSMLDAGICVGIGTDSLASVPTLSMWDEMRFAMKVHRASGVSARDIVHLATLGGARALGKEDSIGSIEVGKRADLIAAPLPACQTGDLYSDLLRETKSCTMTMVNGKILYDAVRR